MASKEKTLYRVILFGRPDCNICGRERRDFGKCCWECEFLEECLPRFEHFYSGTLLPSETRKCYVKSMPLKWCDIVLRWYKEKIRGEKFEES